MKKLGLSPRPANAGKHVIVKYVFIYVSRNFYVSIHPSRAGNTRLSA